MDKLISSLLCCAVDSKDDSDDKIVNQQTNRNRSGGMNKPRNSSSKGMDKNRGPEGGSKSRERDQSKSEDEDVGARNKNKTTSNTKDKVDLVEDDNSVNETDTITNTNESNPTPNNQSQEQPVTPEMITDQEDPNYQDSRLRDTETGDIEEEEVVYEDNDEDSGSFMDLTKLQEGQSYNGETGWLLGVKNKSFGNKKCLVLDLDETLVHSSFKYLRTADFVIPVEIDNQVHHVYVIKRPGVDEFLEKVGRWFEVVVFTASVQKYGDPLLDKLDIYNSVHHRLFRDSCYNYQGNFIKNLSQLGRPLTDSIIIDNSPASYIFHPQHSIPISSWFSDTHDNELLDLLPFLEDISKSNVDDVGLVLDISL